MGQLDKVLEEYLVTKAPALPDNIKDLIVKVAPYLTILGAIMTLQALMATWKIYTAAASFPWMAAQVTSTSFYLSVGYSILTAVLQGLAVPGLLARRKQGWTWLYYVVLVNAVYLLLSMNLVGMVVSTLIGFYLLFQIRPRYRS